MTRTTQIDWRLSLLKGFSVLSLKRLQTFYAEEKQKKRRRAATANLIVRFPLVYLVITVLVLSLLTGIGIVLWHLVEVIKEFHLFSIRNAKYAALWSDTNQQTYQKGIADFMDFCPSATGPVCAPHLLLLRFYNVQSAAFFESYCEEKVQWLFSALMNPMEAQRIVCGANHSSFRPALESFLKAQVLSSEAAFRLSALSSLLLLLFALLAAFCLLALPLLPGLYAARDCAVKSNLIGDFTALLEDLRETQSYILMRRFPIANPDDVEGCVESLESKNFASVTVMTYQVCRLREIAVKLSAANFVDLLSTLSSWIDERLSLYRVFSITDCHNFGVVYSGVFDNAQQERYDVANLSLDLQNFCADLCISGLPLELQKVQMRIGIDSGPVRGGIIRRGEVSRYFISGWACQISKALHVKAPDGCILISRRTYNQLKKTYLYKIKPYETVRYSKEKKIMTYLLTGIEVASISYSSLDIARKDSFLRSTTMTHNMLMERHPVFSEDEILDSVAPRLIEQFYHMRGEERPDSTALPSTSRYLHHSFDASSGRTTSNSSRNNY